MKTSVYGLGLCLLFLIACAGFQRPLTPTQQEFLAYRETLAEKIQKGQISKAEANYLLAQKERELIRTMSFDEWVQSSAGRTSQYIFDPEGAMNSYRAERGLTPIPRQNFNCVYIPDGAGNVFAQCR